MHLRFVVFSFRLSRENLKKKKEMHLRLVFSSFRLSREHSYTAHSRRNEDEALQFCNVSFYLVKIVGRGIVFSFRL